MRASIFHKGSFIGAMPDIDSPYTAISFVLCKVPPEFFFIAKHASARIERDVYADDKHEISPPATAAM